MITLTWEELAASALVFLLIGIGATREESEVHT